MNLNTIIEEIEKIDPEAQQRMDTRRGAMKEFVNIGGKLALAAVPLALGSFFKKAYASSTTVTNTQVLEILNYALTLEYLEAEFYTKGVSMVTIPNAAATNALSKIRDDENKHVAFLKTVITQVGGAGAIVAKPTFDFTAGGTFPTVFSDYATFLAVAQAFEDTGVRAYKGRAAEIVKGGAYLTAALNIHSVEARHASHIRMMRKAAGFATVKPWITGVTSGIGASVNASYAGEDNVSQGGVNITTLAGISGNVTVDAATEAFDEPLDENAVLAIANLFIVH